MRPTFHRGESKAFEKGYRVLADGTLTNPAGKVIGGHVSTGGYIRFRHEAQGACVCVHRLAAFQKFGERIYEPGLVVRHLDGNPQNNSYANLELGTDRENRMDIPAVVRFRTAVTASRGAKKHDHSAVFALHKAGLTYHQIMAQLGISSLGTVSFIIRKSLTAKAA